MSILIFMLVGYRYVVGSRVACRLEVEATLESHGRRFERVACLALVLEAYDAVTASCGIDPSDRLGILADKIADTGFGVGIKVYIDGFTDFTAQERRIIEALLLNNAEVCICLGCDELSGGSEVFEPGRLTARHFIAFAEDNGIPHLASARQTPSRNLRAAGRSSSPSPAY